MHYLIYKISNKLNNKFYVGKHKTEDKNDDYFGSGLLLERAVNKHGKETFVKEILFECKTEDEMNCREADIVDEDFIARDDTYNIKLGGVGGWDYVIKNRLNFTEAWRKTCEKNCAAARKQFKHLLETDKNFCLEWKEKISNKKKIRDIVNGHYWHGKLHSDETKKKMSEAKKGKGTGNKNPAYGKLWITNGIESKLVKKENVPEGWRKGRV